jgi:hypothetical protein
LDEQGACQGHTHPPSSTEFLGFLVLHLDGEPKTEQNLRGTGFGGTRVELVKPAIDAFLKSKKQMNQSDIRYGKTNEPLMRGKHASLLHFCCLHLFSIICTYQ